MLFGFASKITSLKPQAYLTSIGKLSFSVYLIHMPFAGIIVHFPSHIDYWLITVFRPFIVIGTVILCIKLYQFAAGKLRISKLADIMIGVR